MAGRQAPAPPAPTDSGDYARTRAWVREQAAAEPPDPPDSEVEPVRALFASIVLRQAREAARGDQS